MPPIEPSERPSLATARLGGRRHPLDARLRALPRRRLAAIAGTVAVLAVAVLGGLLVLRESELVELDTRWMAEMVENRGFVAEAAARLFDLIGGGLVAVVVIPGGIALAFLLARRPWSALAFLVGSGVSAALVQLMKYGFERTRPLDALLQLDSPSFPSGHTANAATVVVLLGRWSLAVTGALYVAAMALSRTYLGAHWITDTVGGAVLGTAIALLTWAAFEPLLRRERGPGDPARP